MLLSSHILAEVEALCDRVTHHPRRPRRRDRHPAELRHLTPHRRSTPSWPARPTGLADLPGVHDLRVDGDRVRFDVDTAALDAALRRLTEIGVRSLVSQPPTLEELFLRHYEAAPAAARRERDRKVSRGPVSAAQRGTTGPPGYGDGTTARHLVRLIRAGTGSSSALGAAAGRPAGGVRGQLPRAVPDRRRAGRVRHRHRPQPLAGGPARPGLRRQRRRVDRPAGSASSESDRRADRPAHRRPAHPHRGGGRSAGAARRDRARPVRRAHRRAAGDVRGQPGARPAHRRRAGRHRAAGGRLAGVRAGGRRWSGWSSPRWAGWPPSSPRRAGAVTRDRRRGARGGVRCSGWSATPLRPRVAELALAVGLGPARPRLRGGALVGAGPAGRGDRAAGRR